MRYIYIYIYREREREIEKDSKRQREKQAVSNGKMVDVLSESVPLKEKEKNE